MLLIDPITGAEVETFTEKATQHLLRSGYYQVAAPNPEEKPNPKRTTRKRTTKEQ